MTKVLFIDTETGGLDPEKHSLLTVAAVLVDNGEIVLEDEWLVLEDVYRVTARAMEVNKIDLGRFSNAVPIEIIRKELATICFEAATVEEVFQKDTLFLGGHFVEFDVRFLDKYLSPDPSLSNWGKRYFGRGVVDTKSLAIALQPLMPGLKSTSLQDVAEYLGIISGQAHTALDDARTTALVYLEFLKRFKI